MVGIPAYESHEPTPGTFIVTSMGERDIGRFRLVRRGSLCWLAEGRGEDDQAVEIGVYQTHTEAFNAVAEWNRLQHIPDHRYDIR